MQLDKLDPQGQPWDQDTLHALGASAIAWPIDEGPIVDPDISLSGYAAAKAEIVKGRLRAHAATVRYRKEVGGKVVNSHTYLTDRETQAKLTAAVIMAQINPQSSFSWKLADGGFVQLDASALITVAQTIGNFVQQTFGEEAAIVAAIEDGSITTIDEIDEAFA